MDKELKILIVDDNEDVRETMKDILEDEYEKASVHGVGDGNKAIEMARNVDFNIIFIDIRMPGIDGVQTFKEIKKIRPTSGVVMITGYSDENLLEEARREGAYAVLHKPLDFAKIITIINEILNKPGILVVDDRLEDRETLADILEDKGYQVAKVESGYQAIEQIKQKKFGMIFMDVKMPGLDGVETFLKLTKIDPQVPVVMMTGYVLEDGVAKALKSVGCQCIYKPFKVEKILQIIEKMGQVKGYN